MPPIQKADLMQQHNPPTTDSEVAQKSRRRQLTPHERVRIVELEAIGWSYKKIQERFSYISMGTIKTTIARANARGPTQETLPRSGGPKKLSDEDKSMLLNAITEDPDIKYDHLIQLLNQSVTRQTIWKFLREKNKRK